MTDEQLNAAALKLCELNEWKPDEKQGVFGTRLEIAKQKVLAFYQVAKALDSVIGNGELK